MDDERITWVREKPGRRVVQIIEYMPTGFTVTTRWEDGQELFRQDCEVAIRDGFIASGDAGTLN